MAQTHNEVGAGAPSPSLGSLREWMLPTAPAILPRTNPKWDRKSVFCFVPIPCFETGPELCSPDWSRTCSPPVSGPQVQRLGNRHHPWHLPRVWCCFKDSRSNLCQTLSLSRFICFTLSCRDSVSFCFVSSVALFTVCVHACL